MAVKLAVEPEQIEPVEAATVTLGIGFTVRVTTAVLEQVVAGLIAVTVYDGVMDVPVVVCETVVVLLFTPPGFHCQVKLPGFCIATCPLKIVFKRLVLGVPDPVVLPSKANTVILAGVLL